MGSRRPPRTSYGYLAPPGAQVRGWECRHDNCRTGDEPAPRSWPHPCRLCGRPTDPVFEQPWAHEAEGWRIRHDLAGTDPHRRRLAEVEQYVWAYKDAMFQEDGTGAAAAWRGFQRIKRQRLAAGEDWWRGWLAYHMLLLATRFDDIDRAAPEVLEWYPLVDTGDVDEDSGRRTEARQFVSACIGVLLIEASIGHPSEAAVNGAMRDVAARAESVLMGIHHDGFRRIRELRDLHGLRERIGTARRRDDIARDRLPPLRPVPAGDSVPPAPDPPGHEQSGVREPTGGLDPRTAIGLAEDALAALETHDDGSALDALVRRLERASTLPSLRHLLRARRQVAAGNLPAAVRELDRAARVTDTLSRRLLPQIHATRGRVLVLHDPTALDPGIQACRTGRQHGLRWWRRATPADTSLARLLLWRAMRSGTPFVRQAADVREAVRLARRRCRPWHRPAADDRVVLHDALAARDALSGRGTTAARQQAWRRAVDAPWSTAERARMATAWVGWAVGTGDEALVAEAYQHLVALVPLDAAARYGPSAKQRVLAAAQEHTEEAGYWLARARRYREAVVALETGRAVGLTEAIGRDATAVADRLRSAGRGDLAAEYRRALAELDEQERSPSPRLRQAWTDLRDVARRVAAVTGYDPLALDVTYDDVTAAAGDGAVVYLAAARAGGYALVVAARHDPQFVELRKLDRATVAALLGTLPSGPDARSGPEAGRDLGPAEPRTDPLAAMLTTLWDDGIRDLLLHSARGRVVTLVPVGLLSLLPLHAAGRPGTPGERYTEWHAGHFSAIRYAPNARSLRRCQDIARQLTAGRHPLLAVDVPDGSGAGPGRYLRHVARETAAVRRCWPGQGRVIHGCTWAEFRRTADEYSVWHLACHGSAKPHSIMDTCLSFADRQVTLRQLRGALRPGARRLAVLSACESNLTGVTMPNEVVGLPSALLQVGFAGVIASSWKVDDLATAYLMTAFYRQWCQEGHEPAAALNRAQHWLRTATRDDLAALLPGVEPERDGPYPYADPRYWAAFAYTGA